jgi:hypothetical protein
MIPARDSEQVEMERLARISPGRGLDSGSRKEIFRRN